MLVGLGGDGRFAHPLADQLSGFNGVDAEKLLGVNIIKKDLGFFAKTVGKLADRLEEKPKAHTHAPHERDGFFQGFEIVANVTGFVQKKEHRVGLISPARGDRS